MNNITISWLDDRKTAILATFPPEGWTWQDMLQALKQQYALIESVDTPVVDVLVDVSNSNFMPKVQSLLDVIRNVIRDRHPRQGKLIIVGANTFILNVGKIASRLGKGQLQITFAASRQEAHRLLDSHQQKSAAASH